MAVGVAFYDYRNRVGGGYHADRWFHGASTIKLPVLLGVFDAIDRGELSVDSWVHVRNRFLSVVDGAPYRLEAGRDSNSAVHAAIGRTMRVGDLARHMIVTSSNLATNVLVDLVGLEAIKETLQRLGLRGIELRRGVEDMAAWEKGVNNEVTAQGLLAALRVLHDEGHFSDTSRQQMLDILHGQEFRSGIPAGLPDDVRVANKTGEISTAAHDAALVFLQDRDPYAVAILTEWPEQATGRKDAIAAISRAVYELVTEGEDRP